MFQKKNWSIKTIYGNYPDEGRRLSEREQGPVLRGFKRLVFQISCGDFDNVLNEYINYHYNDSLNYYDDSNVLSLKDNFLYIDNENTYLTPEKINVILTDYNSSDDKKNIINKLSSIYITIKPEYIKFVCDNYNNDTFLRLVKRDFDKVIINNPEKRKEHAYY